jgi:hypothetical protein
VRHGGFESHLSASSARMTQLPDLQHLDHALLLEPSLEHLEFLQSIGLMHYKDLQLHMEDEFRGCSSFRWQAYPISWKHVLLSDHLRKKF